MHDRFLNSRGNSGFWNVHSNELYNAAKILWNYQTINNTMTINNPLRKKIGEKIHRFHWTAIMLMGLSLETSLKGKIIKENPLLASDKEFPKNLKNHNLVSLFDKAKISYNKDEKLLLERLTASIKWISKYPIPLEPSDFNSNDIIRSENDFVASETLRERILKSR
ncbi:MAG: hypothetical protein WCT22_05800 [Patescibacteria group bacterium]|jgi:hypothetical protein